MNILKDQKGQSLIEFALILPIVLILLLGILEFGMILNSYLTVQHASREGARLSSVGGSDTEVDSLIKTITPNLSSENIGVMITPVGNMRKRGEAVTVVVSYQYQVMIPMLQNIIGNALQLNAQTIMRVE